MFSIDVLKEYGLTLEQYEQLLNDCSNKVNKISDDDWSEICERYNLELNPDTIRKGSQSPIVGSVFVSEYYKWKESQNKTVDKDKNYFKELRLQKQEIRKEKQKLFDERTALNKTLREQARIEEDLHHLESLISNNAKLLMPNSTNIVESNIGNNDLIVCLSDFHLGIDTESYFGSYNSDIAANRLNEYFEEIVNIKNIHNSENCFILLLGDIISGEIHFTTQLENRENVTEQVQKAAELISEFTYKLSLKFKNVYVNGVAGNHSRTSFKDQVLRGNRLDNLIPWYMKASLSHLDNVKFVDKDNYDSTIGCITVRGHEYLAVHGDYDAFSESGVSKLVLLTDHKPTGIFYGHLHRCSFDTIANIKIIRSGSFAGTVDDYTISKRLCGTPSQMVCVADKTGIKTYYSIELK